MIHTDTYYRHPVVLKPISHLADLVTIDTYQEIGPLPIRPSGIIQGTYLEVVSYVSNDAAMFTPHSTPIDS